MKRFATILGIFTFLLVSSSPAQQRWKRTCGGDSSDVGSSVQQTSDGGYIVAGYTNSFGAGGRDVYLIKTDASGDTLWTRTYGGTGDDYGYSVRQTSDGGYIIAGYTNSFGAGGYDVYLIKTNASGDTLWTRTYGGTKDDYGNSVQQTSDGGYIIAGGANSFWAGKCDVWLIKTNASGDTLWTRTYGGTNPKGGVGYSVQQTSDGGYVIAGTTFEDVYLIKTNASGDTLWTRTCRGGTEPVGDLFGGYDVVGFSVQQTSDGGYIIAGSTEYVGAAVQEVLIKTNAQGDTLWTRAYGGDGKSIDGGSSVQQTSDGGYVIAGFTAHTGPLKKPHSRRFVTLIKTNSSGNTLWTKTYDGTNDHYGDSDGRSVQQTSDGGYVIAGVTYIFGRGERGSHSKVYLIKADANGKSWRRRARMQ